MSSALVVLLRHGATAWSEDARFTSSTDIPLSDEGVTEAAAAARAVRASGFEWTRILSSPASRARTTAAIVAAELAERIEVVVDDRLREVDFGPFEGRTIDEIESGSSADVFARWRHRIMPSFPRGAEPFEEAARRAREVLDEARVRGSCTLLVGHGYLWRLTIAAAVLEMPLGNFRRMRFDTARFAAMQYEGAKSKPRLVLFNAPDLSGLAFPK